MFFKIKETQIDITGKKILFAIDSCAIDMDSKDIVKFLKQSFFESPPDFALLTTSVNSFIYDVLNNLDRIDTTINESYRGMNIQSLYDFALAHKYDSLVFITDGDFPLTYNDYNINTTIILNSYNKHFIKEYKGNVIFYEN
jgi:hypothetical protein